MRSEELVTSICCLNRLDLYKSEKPYEIVFETPDDIPRTNLSTSRHHGIPVQDIRGREESLSLSKNGFCTMALETTMERTDFDDVNAVLETYIPQLAECLMQRLGASRVQVHDYMVRKSHEEFPISTGKPYQYEQPAMLLHIDSSPDGTLQIIKDTNGNESDLLKMRYQYVTVWKPISGPVKRWPLMIVDNSTINTARDLQKRDMVYPDITRETLVAYKSDSYTFHYLSEQKINEALIILQTDSTGIPGSPHTSFPNPLVVDSDPQRESIEVRTLVYYEN